VRRPALTKSRQGYTRVATAQSGGSTSKNLWAGPWWDQALAPTRGSSKYTTSSGAQDGVNLGTAVQIAREGCSSDGVEPGHTPRPRVRPRGAHAVEFSKTVAPLLKGDSFQVGGAPGHRNRSGLKADT
jgi:hypothetical protein